MLLVTLICPGAFSYHTVFIPLTATCIHKTHTERIFRFSIAKWVSKLATVPRYARIAHFVYILATGIRYNGQLVATLPIRRRTLFRSLLRRTNASAFFSLTSTSLLLHAMITDLYGSQLQLF
jgi:hypothetical protein